MGILAWLGLEKNETEAGARSKQIAAERKRERAEERKDNRRWAKRKKHFRKVEQLYRETGKDFVLSVRWRDTDAEPIAAFDTVEEMDAAADVFIDAGGPEVLEGEVGSWDGPDGRKVWKGYTSPPDLEDWY